MLRLHAANGKSGGSMTLSTGGEAAPAQLKKLHGRRPRPGRPRRRLRGTLKLTVGVPPADDDPHLEVLFEHPDGTFLRTGECNHCGECCRLGDPVASGKPHHLAWFTKSELESEDRVADVCPLWRAEGRCAGHGDHPFYRAGCHLYPQHPRDLDATPSCSYRFERVG